MPNRTKTSSFKTSIISSILLDLKEYLSISYSKLFSALFRYIFIKYWRHANCRTLSTDFSQRLLSTEDFTEPQKANVLNYPFQIKNITARRYSEMAWLKWVIRATYIAACIVLFAIASYFLNIGIPHLTNNAPRQQVSAIESIYFNKPTLNTWFYVKLETLDAFTANNPINVTVTTTSLDMDEIHSIQLTFEGADKYFPNSKPSPAPTMPPWNSTQEVWNQYYNATEEYWNNWQKSMEDERKAITANVLWLTSDKNDSDFPDYSKFPFNESGIENFSFPRYSTFSGSLENLNYSTGGTFDIGVTPSTNSSGVIGYGMSDTSFVLKDAIEVSPPETTLQIKSNNIMSGLGWIGIGFPFLLAGLAGMMEIIKHYAFENEK